VPIINALSDFEHPTQIIADYLTILEQHGTIDGFHLGWIGDGYQRVQLADVHGRDL
jgi:ornithine carbamoyltransferase